MACYHPVNAVRLQNGDVKFVSPTVVDGTSFKLPCRQCVGCRLEYSRQWAIRCLDESQMHKANSFITLTNSLDSVSKVGRSLNLKIFQLFMKRLRKEVSPLRIRFFHCGEYTQSFLPHYHSLIFGYDFPDRKYFKLNKSGQNKLYISDQLARLWPYGHHYIGDVTFESAAYVARYVLKKVKTSRDDEERLIMKDTGEILDPEYITMSRRPGIGRAWYDRYKSDVYPLGNRVVRGRNMRPPVYYDRLFAVDDPYAFEDLQFMRENSFDKQDNTELRLSVKEKVTTARLKLFPRE